jgi:hypothetical protein
MPKQNRFLIVLVLCLSALVPTSARAQNLVNNLVTLLTEQRASATFVPDASAALATTVTVASLFAVELGTLPQASSAGGFVYRHQPNFGIFERATNDFGPFFTERALRNGKGQTSIGLSFQVSNFSSLQGADLTDGTFPTNAARNSGVIDPFSFDFLTLNLHARTTTALVSHGVTDRLTVGGTIPFVSVSFDGQRVRTVDGQRFPQSVQSGAASGLGDISLNGRYRLAGDGPRGFSVGGDLRLPTGRQEDLLGVEDAAGRFIAIASWEEGRLAAHANGGFGVGGASDEVFWGMATTFAPLPRLTFVSEFTGRYLSDLTRVQDVYQPHPVLAGVETMRWLPGDKGLHTMFVVAGAKWNVGQSWLLNTNLLIRVTDGGLRARITPAISFDYTFEP